jgi:cytochrome c5
MKKIFIILIFLLSGLIGFLTSLYFHRDIEEQQSDTQLIQTFHYPALFVKQLAGDPHAGEKIFKEFCVSCHGKQPLIDVHAPKLGDKAAWSVRRKMGMPALLNITITGVGAMPARGGCFECSDEQLRETIQYIFSESFSKK